MKEISLQVLLHIVFGLGDRSRHEKLRYVLTELFTLFESPLLIGNLLAETFSLTFLQQEWGVWGDLRQLQRDLDQIVAAEIEQKRTQKELLGKDLLSLLITACDENGQAMTDQEIRNALMTLIFAGFETAAAAMSWAFYWVNYAPGIREKLINELSSQPSNIEPSVIARLPYLGAVCQETLRINPPTMSAFSRTVNQPVEIDGYRLEPGTEIDVSIYLAHRRGSVYPEPDKFRPERFLERQFSPYEYLPFGGGQCRCLGASLAQYQMKLVLATILKNFRLQLVDPQSVKPVRHGIIMIPEGLMAIVSLPC